MKKKLVISSLLALLHGTALAQGSNDWGAPSDNPSGWGSRTDDLNPIAPQNVRKLDREQSNPLNDAVIPKPTVPNPFDSNGMYVGESQVITGTGVDPATGEMITDSPRQQ